MATPTNQELLDKVATAIQNLLDGGVVASYSIGGRNIQHYSLKELMDLRNELQKSVAVERGNTRNYVSFMRPS